MNGNLKYFSARNSLEVWDCVGLKKHLLSFFNVLLINRI